MHQNAGGMTMRKATGVCRSVDDLGRVVIPVELRRTLGINIGDPLRVDIDNNGAIILTPHQPGCVFCGESGGSVGRDTWAKGMSEVLRGG